MTRQYILSLAAGAALTLLPAAAHADRSARESPEEKPLSEQQPVRQVQTGVASYYGKAHHGKRTASGVRFDQNAMTAAHPWLPFGTRIRVTHVASGRSVIVVVNDRLPSKRRIIDLSVGAARELGMISQGVAEVVITLA